jgi:hypothetical protein
MNYKPNQYYQDPIDLWFERHPFIGSLALGLFLYACLVLLFLI